MKKMIFPFKAKRKPREKPPCHSFRGEREEKGKRGNVFKTQAIGACYAQLVSPLILSYAMARCCLFSPYAAFKVLSVLNLIAPLPPFRKRNLIVAQWGPLPTYRDISPPLQCPLLPPLLPGPGGIAPQPHFKVLFPPTAPAAWLACNSHTERAIVGKGTDGGGGGGGKEEGIVTWLRSRKNEIERWRRTRTTVVVEAHWRIEWKREGETPSHGQSRKAASGTVGQKNSLLIFAFLSLLWLPLEKKCYPEAVYGEVYMLLFMCREISRRILTDRLKNGRSWSFGFFFFAHSNDRGYAIFLVFTYEICT